MVDIYAERATSLDLGGHLQGEVAFVIVKGSISEEGEKVEAGQMLISKTNETCSISLEEDTQLLLFGGEPLAHEPYLLWNFVSSDKEKLQQAKNDWIQRKFPKIPGDDTYIPFPKG